MGANMSGVRVLSAIAVDDLVGNCGIITVTDWCSQADEQKVRKASIHQDMRICTCGRNWLLSVVSLVIPPVTFAAPAQAQFPSAPIVSRHHDDGMDTNHCETVRLMQLSTT
jgi:hypothetical protein